MLKKIFLLCFFLMFLGQGATAAGQADSTQDLINDVDALLSQTESLRERFPGHVSTDQLRACSSQARPMREEARQLMKRARDTSVPFSVRMSLSQAADKTFECLACTTDGSACGVAKAALKQAKETIKATERDLPTR